MKITASSANRRYPDTLRQLDGSCRWVAALPPAASSIAIVVSSLGLWAGIWWVVRSLSLGSGWLW
jgi:hypothetical protein